MEGLENEVQNNKRGRVWKVERTNKEGDFGNRTLFPLDNDYLSTDQKEVLMNLF